MVRIASRWIALSTLAGVSFILSVYSMAHLAPAPVASFQARQGGPSGNSYAIYLYDWQTRHTYPIISDVRPEQYAWSPDGHSIAVTELADTGITFTLYDVRSGQVRVPPRRGLFPVWSPDSQRVAFVRAAAYGNAVDSDVVVLTLATHTETNLTNSPDVDENYPFWSADGDAVVYYAQGDGDAARWQRTALDSRHTVPQMLPAGAVVSPDGQWMARLTADFTSGQLQVFDREGQLVREREVMNTANDILWSPDSRYVALAQPLPLGIRGLASFPIIIYDVGRDTLLARLEAWREHLTMAGAAWVPDGHLSLLVVDQTNGARAWVLLDVATHTVQRRAIPAALAPSNLQWQPN